MSVCGVQPGDPVSAGELAWRRALHRVITEGATVAPRGQTTYELLAHTVSCDLARAVVTSPARKLNYKFMCAEALWILDGLNTLAPLTRFVTRMAEFSDDGETLAGAYGPRLVPQLPYVVDALVRDRDTRQAVASIWTPSPAPSKDLPCTLAVTFSVRDGKLYQHVMMRSSDLWLGIPYDFFSFSTWGIYVACAFNSRLAAAKYDGPIGLGALTVTASSSHLYHRDLAAAQAVLATTPSAPVAPCPDELVRAGAWKAIRADLIEQREGHPALAWQVVP